MSPKLEAVPELMVPKERIKYPSPANPRLTKMNRKDPEIMELADSIRKFGLQYPVLLRKLPDESYTPIDGSRRCVAVFDILNQPSIRATVQVVDDKKSLGLMLITNYERKTFSPLEIGSSLWQMVCMEMEEHGQTPIEDFWKDMMIRGEYLETIAARLEWPTDAVRKYINIWRDTPEDVRTDITYRKPQLQKSQFCNEVALDISTAGREIGDVEGTWKLMKNPKVQDIFKKPTPRKVVMRAIRAGQIKTVAALESYVTGTALETIEYKQFMTVETRDLIARLASKFNARMDNIVSASVHVAQNHLEDLKTALGA